MKNYFKGYYFKHQKDDFTLSVIVGISNTERFIQIITNEYSEKIPFEKGNYFSKKGILLNIHSQKTSLSGSLKYKDLSPIRYDIMGPFSIFPMQCKHGIISMKHRIEGSVVLNGNIIDFTDGTGYIEMDEGSSFPSSYMWVQANDIDKNCAITAAVARIPFLGFHFRGVICMIQYKGKEYRMATYYGARIIKCSEDEMILRQGRYTLRIKVDAKSAFRLAAPEKGEMNRTILEAISCPAYFHFMKKDKSIFQFRSQHASYEYENDKQEINK